MSLNNSCLAVTPPLNRSKLGRYRDMEGVYILRKNEEVLFIGSSTSLYKAINRIFQGKGTLSDFDPRNFQFEILTTEIRFHTVKEVLKRHFKPKYNKRMEKLEKLSKYQKRHFERILNSYLEQSFFGIRAEQKGDYPESMEGNAKGDY